MDNQVTPIVYCTVCQIVGHEQVVCQCGREMSIIGWSESVTVAGTPRKGDKAT